MKQLARLKTVFPNRAGLYSRIDTALAGSSVVRIGILPHASTREQIKPILESLVADPIEDSQWFPALQERPLTKDVIVSQSSSFDYVETRNSAIEYPIPFRGPAVEFVEATSLNASKEHLAACDLHILASVEPSAALVAPVNTEHPRLIVLDSPTLLNIEKANPTMTSTDGYNGSSIIVATSTAKRADDLLRESPQNISAFLDLYKQSNLTAFKKAVFDTQAIRKALVQSIFTTCETIIEETKQTELSADPVSEIATLRQSWASGAHLELQSVLLPSVENLIHRHLTWWKLYFKVDDVESLGAAELNSSFLPASRERLDYLVGRIDQAASGVESEDNPQIVWRETQLGASTAVTRLHNQAIKSVVTALFGVQVPIAALSVAGYYFADFSGYAMGALAGLGIVVGLQRLQKMWYTAGQEYSKTIEHLALNAISRTDKTLWDMYENKVVLQDSVVSEQEQVLKEVMAEANTVAVVESGKAPAPRAVA